MVNEEASEEVFYIGIGIYYYNKSHLEINSVMYYLSIGTRNLLWQLCLTIFAFKKSTMPKMLKHGKTILLVVFSLFYLMQSFTPMKIKEN